MRGKVFTSKFPEFHHGITPAYAGKSMVGKFPRKIHRDHPRLCGEKVKTNGKSATERGSPPPMRGKAGKLIRRQSGKGITPAYAGKSLTEKQKAVFGKDHPRLCGEKHR